MDIIKKEELEYKKQHQKILSCAKRLGEAFYDYLKALKEMHDSKLYLAVGYTSFEDYTSKTLNIKKSQAYDNLSIISSFTKEFIEENSMLGSTKLKLLSKLSEEDAEKIIQHVDVENTSIKEIKNVINKCQESGVEEALNGDIEESIEDSEIETFGSYLRKKRLAANISIKEMANRLLISVPYYTNIEGNRRLPVAEFFYSELKSIFNLSMDDMELINTLRDRYYSSRSKVAKDLNDFIASDERIVKIIRVVKNSEDKLNRILKIIA